MSFSRYWASDKDKGEIEVQFLIWALSTYSSPNYNIQYTYENFAIEDFCSKILTIPIDHPELNPVEVFFRGLSKDL